MKKSDEEKLNIADEKDRILGFLPKNISNDLKIDVVDKLQEINKQVEASRPNKSYFTSVKHVHYEKYTADLWMAAADTLVGEKVETVTELYKNVLVAKTLYEKARLAYSITKTEFSEEKKKNLKDFSSYAEHFAEQIAQQQKNGSGLQQHQKSDWHNLKKFSLSNMASTAFNLAKQGVRGAYNIGIFAQKDFKGQVAAEVGNIKSYVQIELNNKAMKKAGAGLFKEVYKGAKHIMTGPKIKGSNDTAEGWMAAADKLMGQDAETFTDLFKNISVAKALYEDAKGVYKEKWPEEKQQNLDAMGKIIEDIKEHTAKQYEDKNYLKDILLTQMAYGYDKLLKEPGLDKLTKEELNQKLIDNTLESCKEDLVTKGVDKEHIEEVFKNIKFDPQKIIISDNTDLFRGEYRCLAYVDKENNQLIFANAGTRPGIDSKGASDLWADIKIASGGKVGRKSNVAAEFAEAILNKFGEGATHVHCTGHSLGAAIADVQAADIDVHLQRNKKDDIKVSSRVFDNPGIAPGIIAGRYKDGMQSKVEHVTINNGRNFINELHPEKPGKVFRLTSDAAVNTSLFGPLSNVKKQAKDHSLRNFVSGYVNKAPVIDDKEQYSGASLLSYHKPQITNLSTDFKIQENYVGDKVEQQPQKPQDMPRTESKNQNKSFAGKELDRKQNSKSPVPGFK
jgi:hypothetical protein